MDGTEYYQEYLAGDEGALAQIIRLYKDGLILYLSGYVKDITLAEELTEETFVKLVMKRPRFSGNASFKTWLYAVGRNAALDYLRRHKPREVSLEDCPEAFDEEQDLERTYIQQEDRILVQRAMKKLKLEYRQVLWLLYFEDFTHKEAARILRKTTHNVETIAYRARQALKTKLLEEGYVYEKL